MMAVPPATPTTTPEAEPIVATVGSLLLQTPPEVATLNAVEEPAQMAVLPVMADGTELTVTMIAEVQPPPSE